VLEEEWRGKSYASRPKCWPSSSQRLADPAREAWIKDMKPKASLAKELYVWYPNIRRKTRVN